MVSTDHGPIVPCSRPSNTKSAFATAQADREFSLTQAPRARLPPTRNVLTSMSPSPGTTPVNRTPLSQFGWTSAVPRYSSQVNGLEHTRTVNSETAPSATNLMLAKPELSGDDTATDATKTLSWAPTGAAVAGTAAVRPMTATHRATRRIVRVGTLGGFAPWNGMSSICPPPVTEPHLPPVPKRRPLVIAHPLAGRTECPLCARDATGLAATERRGPASPEVDRPGVRAKRR